ncbi:MAG: ORF6N domain-containing protein [Kiritimatiellae bacterium]|nr:ORF6N domain-containing protein [Kiritimatiellia bacterium]
MNMTDFPLIRNTELAGSRIPATDDFIKSRIFTVRGLQVVVDRDLAELYGVQTKVLNQAVKRNANRFPPEFMFVLAKDETEELVTNCDRFASMKHSSVPMRAFSEHGVIMVASVLKSDIAAQISVRITRVFVAMRKALASIAPILMRIDNVEQRQIADRTRNEENQRRNEERFDTIFRAMDGGDFPPQKVFFEGKHYDAYSFAKKLVRKAAKSIVLVDGYSDEVALDILSQKKGGVAVLVATSQKMIDRHLTPVAVEKFNKQNPTLKVKAVGTFHDRFLILDDKELYHFGASLKDLGRQYCAVSKMDAMFIPSIMQRIQ